MFNYQYISCITKTKELYNPIQWLDVFADYVCFFLAKNSRISFELSRVLGFFPIISMVGGFNHLEK